MRGVTGLWNSAEGLGNGDFRGSNLWGGDLPARDLKV